MWQFFLHARKKDSDRKKKHARGQSTDFHLRGLPKKTFMRNDNRLRICLCAMKRDDSQKKRGAFCACVLQ